MDYRQETRIALPSPGQLFTPGVTLLLLLAVTGFLGSAFVPDKVAGTLALHPQAVLQGRVWQLVTYPFVNGADSLVFNGLILLFLGSAIERQWRTASFLCLWLTVSFGCGVLWVLINLLTGGSATGMGATAGSYGLVATVGLLFRGTRYFVFVATVEAQYLALGLIVIGIIAGLSMPITLVWVAGAPVAYVYVKACWSLGARGSARPPAGRSGGRGPFIEID